MMGRKPKYGESYFYIDDNKIVSRRNSLQDTDFQNIMTGNYYLSEAKARLDLSYMRISRKGKK